MQIGDQCTDNLLNKEDEEKLQFTSAMDHRDARINDPRKFAHFPGLLLDI